jgi:DNA-binding response OmpR family regulator
MSDSGTHARAAEPVIFVVEDEADIARLICYHLETSGFLTRWYPDSLTVVSEARECVPALFLLDVMLPGGDGFELSRRIRLTPILSSVPIVFVTAKTSEADRIKGLELGGDDYIVKPFSPRELVARVRAILRRSRETYHPEVMKVGELEVDTSAMAVKVRGQAISTTMREFRLLEYLVRYPMRVFTRDQILQALWVESAFVTQRSVDVYVRRLREKIEADPENPEYLKTIRGVGYRFEIPK